MRDLSQLVSEDSRKPIDRLRRVQLWKIADALGLNYPVGAPKTTMVALLEANDVDVTRPIAGIQWRVTQGTSTNGVPHQEIYPLMPEHASARKNVNAEVALSQRLSEKTKQEKAFEDSRMKALEQENARLKSLEEENAKLKEIIEKRLAALEDQKTADEKELSQPAANRAGYWEKYKKAKSLGLPVTRQMKVKEIEALIASVEQ